ncbi:MAG TPA: phosphatase PAP2 family protein [Candidatus Paceibacterota bacterium]|nr:phosphatase PAP2 family protein [Candidatus Paceibacterota bacterium]
MNEKIFYFFYNLAHQSAFFDNLIIFTAVYFPYLVGLLVFLFLLAHHDILSSKSPFEEFAKKWKEISFVFFSGGLAWVIAKVLKILIQSPRPTMALTNVHSLFTETGYTFPSGHATFFMALAVTIFFFHKKAGYGFMFLALLIGLARVTSGVHYPIDILGGFILGSLVAWSLRCFITNSNRIRT